MKISDVEQILKMTAAGMSPADIADELERIAEETAEAAAEAEADADFERRAYGVDDHERDDWTSGQVEYHDRLSMGRNDAGEWLGFM